MKTIRTTLREKLGLLGRSVIRKELLAERGVHAVSFEPSRNWVIVEYDPVLADDERLIEIMCRHSTTGRRGEAVIARDDSSPRMTGGPMPNEPEQWTETLTDGRKVLIRPIRADDVARNARFLDELSPPSKHFLFLGGIARLSDEALRRLCDLDYADDMAYVALSADSLDSRAARQIGVCRYAGASDKHGAEISVAVADDWQHHGLGKKLLRHLIDYARRHGVHRLYSLDSADNERMRRLAQELGFAETRDPDDPRQSIFSLELA